MHPTRRFLALSLLVVLTLAGCGWWRAETARRDTLIQQLDAYVIPKPVDEVWKSVRAPSGTYDQLMWDGMTWTDDGLHKMHTNRHRDVTKASSGSPGRIENTWYKCEATSTPAGTQVHYTRFVETIVQGQAPSVSSDRDPQLELELVKLVDAPAGARIEAAGETAAKQAK